MISRSGKGNFFAAHYEWLAAGVGILALVGAGAFCFLGGDAEADIEAATVSISGRGKERAAVADADLTGCCRSTNVSKTVELARRIEDRFLGSFASEKRVFCISEACGRAMPEKYDEEKNLVCVFCGVTQKVAQVAKPLDADEDGLPDAWEKKYGLNPADAADAAADADGDDFSNLEEYLAKTDPTDAKDHPDYLDSLAIELPLKKTYLPFIFLSAPPVPKSWRCEFFDASRKDSYGRKGVSTSVLIGENIGDSGFVLKSYEKKSEKRAIKGSVNKRDVDVSEVVIERKRDGKQLTLTVAESRKEKPMSVDVQAKLTYSRRGAVKNFDVVAGSEITLSGAKYTISEIKTVGDGAEITVENGLTGKKRKLVSP